MVEKTNKKKTLVILDSHAIIHRAYHALPDFASSKGEPTGALYGLSAMLISIIEKFKPEYIIAAYDLPQPTYRHEAYEAYKAGRKKTDDNLISQLKKSREVFEAFNIPIYDMPGFEADDILGTIVEKLKDNKEIDIIIASGDMDTLQLVTGKKVRVYTLKKGIKDIVVYDESAVKERYGFDPKYLPDYKGLRGDPSDNIVGIKGIGEKTATTLISNFGTIENIYKNIKKDEEKVKKVGITDRIFELLKENEEEALFSKMLGTIRRDAPIDFNIPEKTWSEDYDFNKIEKLYQELEFRSLIIRVKSATFINKSLGLDTGDSEGATDGKAGAKGKKGSVVKEDVVIVEPELEKRLKIMLWLIDSNMSDPSLDDIWFKTKTKNPEEAEKFLKSEIDKNKLNYVLDEVELPLIPVLEKMKEVGVRIDVDYLNKLSKDFHVELEKLEKNIWKEAGVEFNVASPKQLGEILFVKMNLGVGRVKKTATGAFSTKESELEKLKGKHPIIDNILEYRELAKLLSTYIDALPKLVDENNRLHTRFIQTGTTTGRMSSQEPNLQNVPIKSELGKKVRNAFIADKGYKILSIDYSQIELRIAAILSGDEKMIKIFKDGIDIHSGVASQIFKIPVEEVNKDMRRKAKVINFGILFGMGVSALKTNLGGTREEAQQFYNDYFETFLQLADFLNQTKEFARKNGYTETMFGRKRYFSGLKSPLPYIRVMAEQMAINAPIQGTEADLIKLAMVRIEEYIHKEKLESEIRMLLQVHDELVFEIKDGSEKKIVPQIMKIMESVMPEDRLKGVPIISEASVGENWGQMENFK